MHHHSLFNETNVMMCKFFLQLCMLLTTVHTRGHCEVSGYI